ncbi:type IV secretory system conjugative DNA transfer family protein [Chryseobacterium gambrini]|uniref:type IV secretory system conjugative DNA transfer family protein n=1 Tax=Chryseobacterium gambrini TaxID=373672 RepID=UPI003D0C65B4
MTNFNLDIPLFSFAKDRNEGGVWTVRNAVEGVQIFGGIGSGKTSGSGRTLAIKYLKHGFGGLVLTVKKDEEEEWRKYFEAAGRSIDDLIVIEPNRGNFFNVLEYESKEGNITENIVQVLKTVINASEEKSGSKSNDPFWDQALDMLLFNIIDLCRLAYGRLSFKNMYEIVQSLPTSKTIFPKNDESKQTAFMRAFLLAQKNAAEKTIIWLKQKEAESNPIVNDASYENTICDNVPEARIMKEIDNFFVETYAELNEKTRSIIDFSCSGFLFRLLREPVYSLFCNNESNITPDDCSEGKVILVNLPVKVYHKIGRDCQIMFKYIWQRAMEKRDIDENPRPVFLFADEAQNFVHENDAECQATARSSRIATVYISQNLPNYYANMGGGKFEYKVKSFLGTLATKIFHANADVETNKYASDLIGDSEYENISRNIAIAGKPNISSGRSLVIERAVRPEQFVSLKTGTNINNSIVEGYIHVQGNPIKNGKNFTIIPFNQNYVPKVNS